MDEQGFRVLYRSYYGDVTRYVGRRLDSSTGTPDVADVVATVFMTAWRRRGEIPDDRRLAWLYGVARRTVANEVRARRRAGDLRKRVADAYVNEATGNHADAVVSRIALSVAFDALSDRDQEVLRLIAWESLSVAEAAGVLACSTAACAVRLHRARRRLRRLLGDGSSGSEREHGLIRSADQKGEPR